MYLNAVEVSVEENALKNHAESSQVIDSEALSLIAQTRRGETRLRLRGGEREGAEATRWLSSPA
jgi:hypothetical protein